MSLAFLIKTSRTYDGNVPRCIILDDHVVKIGRKVGVFLDTSIGKEISKHHSTIIRKFSRFRYKWTLIDESSLNGTFVNRQKILKMRLHNYDDIIFGGGAKICYGDFLPNSELSECAFKFYIPHYPLDFYHCKDYTMSLNELDLSIECSVCFSCAHRLQSLPCNHIFCVKCLKSWVHSCLKAKKQLLCPVCREPFKQSCITKAESSIHSGKEIIKTIGPLLRTSKAQNILELQSVSIKNSLTKEELVRFWQFVTLCCEYKTVMRMLLHVMGIALYQIMEYDIDTLKIIVLNLGGEISDNIRVLLSEAIGLISLCIIGVEKHQPKKPKNKFG